MWHYYYLTPENSAGLSMRSLLHSCIASMIIIGLPDFLHPEEFRTQEILYHFTSLCIFVTLFRPRMSKLFFVPTISFEYRNSNDQESKEFLNREARYNFRMILITIIGSMLYRVN